MCQKPLPYPPENHFEKNQPFQRVVCRGLDRRSATSIVASYACSFRRRSKVAHGDRSIQIKDLNMIASFADLIVHYFLQDFLQHHLQQSILLKVTASICIFMLWRMPLFSRRPYQAHFLCLIRHRGQTHTKFS